jgi:hypothetical protein
MLFNKNSMAAEHTHARTIWLAVALWLAATGAGLAGMAAYANRPGALAVARADWPAESHLVKDAARPTLVMVAHPQCDCTRASLAELAELLAEAPGAARAYVLFVVPRGADASWNTTGLWERARAIPGVIAIRDEDGVEGRRFGALTSGQTFLYGTDGRLRFSGGTTPARGHEGDSVGVSAMVDVLTQGRARTAQAPVFGCALFDEPRAAVRAESQR